MRSVSTAIVLTASALLYVTRAQAAFSPVVGQAGFRCAPSACGDAISASAGFDPAIGVEGVPYKPVTYVVEVPPVDPRSSSVPVGFDLRFFDIGMSSTDQIGDHCFPEKNQCDTPTLVRIFPPDSGSTCRDAVAEFAIDPGKDCSAIGVGPCDDLDGRELRIHSAQSAGLDLLDLGLPRECVVPGLWRVEVHTGEFTRTAIPEGGYDDVDVYRFGATQALDRSSCRRRDAALRVFTNALNLARPPEVPGVATLAWTDVRGGWSFELDAVLPQPPPANPITQVLPSYEDLDVPITSFPVLNEDEFDVKLFNVQRIGLPSAYLSDTGDFVQDGASRGYPINVSFVDAQGFWGFIFKLDSTPPVVTLTARLRRDLSVTDPTTFPWLNTTIYREGPTLYPNTLPIYFPATESELRDPCSGVPEMSFTAPEPAPEDQLTRGGRAQVEKPNVIHRARGLGIDERGRSASEVIRCYEQELRVVVPNSATGAIDNLQLFTTLSSDPRIRFIGFSGCSDNVGQQGVETISSALEPSRLRCPNAVNDSTTPWGDEDAGQKCPTNNSEYEALPSTGPFEVRFDANMPLNRRETAFVRYTFAVRTERGRPVFFTERTDTDGPADRPTGSPLGNRARWVDETSNATPSIADLPPPSKIGQGLSYGGGGSTGSGGSSTSGDGTDDPSQLATLDGVRAVEGPDGARILELTTSSEVLTGGFRVAVLDTNHQWQPLGPFLSSAPSRQRGLYRLRLPEDLATPVRVRVSEHELTGAIRDHGEFELIPVPVPVLPDLGFDGTLSIERPSLEPAPPMLALRTTAPPPGERARFSAPERGGYRVTYSMLASALRASAPEIAARAAAGELRLSQAGQSVAYVADAEGIAFWSEGAVGARSLAPNFVVSLEKGRRARLGVEAELNQSAAARSFAELRFEEDRVPAPATQSYHDDDLMMWKALRAGAGADAVLEHRFDAPRAEGDGAKLTLAVRGGSASARFPDHGLQVRLNGEIVGNVRFYGFDDRRFELDIPAGLLLPSDNLLEVESFLAPGLAFSVEWVDWITLRYSRNTAAENDRLLLDGSGEGVLTLTGFSRPDVQVWEIGDGEVERVLPTRVAEAGSGFEATFANGYRESPLFAFVPRALPEIANVVALGGEEVREFVRGAEYVVVAHPGLMEGARALAEHRQDQGLSTVVFSADSLYDAFTDGLEDPEALRSFLLDAERRWEIRPSYVVLIGDASFDLDNAMGRNDNLLPTQLSTTEKGFFGSDTLLGDVGSGPGLEVAVGRIPAQSDDDVLTYLDKVRTFESISGTLGAQSALLVADDPDEAGDFSRSLDEAIAALSDDFFIETVQLEPDEVSTARDRVLAALGAGTRFLSYIGHGGILGLAGEGVLTRDDIELMNNQDSPMLLLAATCLVGRFEVPGIRTFAESLLLDGADGAAAVFASAALETNAQSTLLTRVLAERLAARDHKRLGAALRDASQLALAQGLRRSALELHTVLGDPALVVWRDAPEAALRRRSVLTDDAPLAPPPSPSWPREPETEASGGCGATPPSVIAIIALVAVLRRRQSRS